MNVIQIMTFVDTVWNPLTTACCHKIISSIGYPPHICGAFFKAPFQSFKAKTLSFPLAYYKPCVVASGKPGVG